MRFGRMDWMQRIDVSEMREENSGHFWWHALLYVFLIYVFVTGGSAQLRGWTDAIAELAALPILAISLWRLAALPPSRVRTFGLLVMAAVALFPWLQLLPLGDYFWSLAPARKALNQDLAAVGVSRHASTWSLIPSGNVRAGLSMLPAVALFFAVVCEDSRTQRRLLTLCVLLPLASLVLGFLQLGAPQDSLLNPYPQWAPSMGGTFANPNHQGTSMLVGLGVCLAYATGTLGQEGIADTSQGLRRRNPWPAIIGGSTLLLGLPLTNSRAAVVIGVLILVAAPLAMAATTLRQAGHTRRGIVALLLAAAVGALGLAAAMGWMKIDEIEELRGVLRRATFDLGFQHLPWGSGVGSFVPTFQQALPESLLLTQFANAAHNDIVQVWLEAGWFGAILAGLSAVALSIAALTHFRSSVTDRRLVWSALLGLFAIGVHAAADYALRTPALMTVAALLAAVLISQGAQPERSEGIAKIS